MTQAEVNARREGLFDLQKNASYLRRQTKTW